MITKCDFLTMQACPALKSGRILKTKLKVDEMSQDFDTKRTCFIVFKKRTIKQVHGVVRINV